MDLLGNDFHELSWSKDSPAAAGLDSPSTKGVLTKALCSTDCSYIFH